MRAMTFKEKVKLRHSLSTVRTKIQTRRICQPCLVGKHPHCNLDTCCCVCNEKELSFEENLKLRQYYIDRS